MAEGRSRAARPRNYGRPEPSTPGRAGACDCVPEKRGRDRPRRSARIIASGGGASDDAAGAEHEQALVRRTRIRMHATSSSRPAQDRRYGPLARPLFRASPERRREPWKVRGLEPPRPQRLGCSSTLFASARARRAANHHSRRQRRSAAQVPSGIIDRLARMGRAEKTEVSPSRSAR